jgi:hypothetical protein
MNIISYAFLILPKLCYMLRPFHHPRFYFPSVTDNCSTPEKGHFPAFPDWAPSHVGLTVRCTIDSDSPHTTDNITISPANWLAAVCHFHVFNLEDGGSTFLRNLGIHLQDYKLTEKVAWSDNASDMYSGDDRFESCVGHLISWTGPGAITQSPTHSGCVY